ncbi:hypothetical protein GQ42DRAFT_159676, partial [Ramicandelaber brevisporus]
MSADYAKVERSSEPPIAEHDATARTIDPQPANGTHEAGLKLEIADDIDDAPSPAPSPASKPAGFFARLLGKKNKNGDAGNDGKTGEKDEKKDNGPPPVPVLQLFRFATGQDRILMLIGILCGVGMGAAQPLMVIVFGNILDGFN